MNSSKISYNFIAAIVVQVVSIVINLLIPQLIIGVYGSTINGLIVTSTQIVSYFGILEGSVAISAGASLYKFFAKNEQSNINSVMSAVSVFYKKSGLFFLALLLIFVSALSISNFGVLPISTTILVVLSYGLVSIVSYIYFNRYNMLFLITGRHYINLLSSCVYYILLTIIQYTLIKLGTSITIVVLAVPILAMLRLLWMRHYICKIYPFLDFNAPRNRAAIKEKYNALFVNISALSKTFIPILFLSFFVDLKYVSVYSIYAILFHIGSSIFETVSNSITPFFGSLIHSNDINSIRRYYAIFDFFTLVMVSFLSLTLLNLTIPFIRLYIPFGTDVNYIVPIFVVTFVINEALSNLRFASKTLIKAKGEFKAIRGSGFVELAITLTLTPLVVLYFGYEYILLPCIIGSLYQLLFYHNQIKKHYNISWTSRYYIFIFIVIAIIVVSYMYINLQCDTIASFIITSAIVAIISLSVLLVIAYIINRDTLMAICSFFLKKKNREKLT